MLEKCPLCSPGWFEAHGPSEYSIKAGIIGIWQHTPHDRTASVFFHCSLAIV